MGKEEDTPGGEVGVARRYEGKEGPRPAVCGKNRNRGRLAFGSCPLPNPPPHCEGGNRRSAARGLRAYKQTVRAEFIEAIFAERTPQAAFPLAADRTHRVPDTMGVPHIPVGRTPLLRSGCRPRTADLGPVPSPFLSHPPLPHRDFQHLEIGGVEASGAGASAEGAFV